MKYYVGIVLLVSIAMSIACNEKHSLIGREVELENNAVKQYTRFEQLSLETLVLLKVASDSARSTYRWGCIADTFRGDQYGVILSVSDIKAHGLICQADELYYLKDESS